MLFKFAVNIWLKVLIVYIKGRKEIQGNGRSKHFSVGVFCTMKAALWKTLLKRKIFFKGHKPRTDSNKFNLQICFMTPMP